MDFGVANGDTMSMFNAEYAFSLERVVVSLSIRGRGLCPGPTMAPRLIHGARAWEPGSTRCVGKVCAHAPMRCMLEWLFCVASQL